MIDESLKRRLILAKTLFLHGSSHATREDEVSRMLALHNFDNAIEILLKCIASKRGIKFEKWPPKFRGLLKRLKLPLSDQILSLHEVRNIVQHQGDIPDKETVIKYKGYAEDFFRKIIKDEFNLSFEELSLASLIKNKELRNTIFKAEKAFEKGNYKNCIIYCDEALSKATFEVADIFGKAGMLTGYFGAGNELKKVINKQYFQSFKQEETRKLAKDISRAILQLGLASTGMQFLDEYRSGFLEFRGIISKVDNVPKEKLKEKAQFCLNFVIGLLIKWQTEGVIK